MSLLIRAAVLMILLYWGIFHESYRETERGRERQRETERDRVTERERLSHESPH